MKKSILFTIAISIIAIHLNAQSLAPSTINSTGANVTVGGKFYEYSVGEMCVISTFKVGSTSYTNGVLQPGNDKSTIAISNIELAKTSFNIYPNPLSDQLFISSLKNETKVNSIIIYDILGKVIYLNNNPEFKGNDFEIDFGNFASSNYVLNINTSDNNFTYKINKSK
jgi:hypothetical protein